jgi:hypothetical protein
MSQHEDAQRSSGACPSWIVVSGTVVLVGSGAIVLRLLYEQTILTWEQGPQMVGFSLAHVLPGALILGILFLLLLHIWLLIAIPTVLRRMFRRKPVALRAKIVVCCVLLVLAALYVPYGWWRYLMLKTSGPGQHGASHLVYAAAMGELYNVRTLVSHGVPVDATGGDGTTALMGASVEGRLDVVKYLVGAGAKINYQGGILSQTALMDAAEMRHSDVVEYLLQVGADRKLVDRDGKTALDRAGNDKRVLAVFGEEQRR